MTWQAPNLAREPFENSRPARRLGLALTVAALALTAWNVGTWWRTGHGAAERALELQRLTHETSQARQRIATLEGDLGAVDLARANEVAAFLNERIDERMFSWNRLLDDMVEAMPPGVRLDQLTPKRQEGTTVRRSVRSRRVASSPLEERDVQLRIRGRAEDDEALLEFVDRLFAHPEFREPNLSGENRSSSGELSFDLSVVYRPDLPVADAAAP